MWVLVRTASSVLTSIHNLCFEQTYENYQNFLLENFQFLVVKFLVTDGTRSSTRLSDTSSVTKQNVTAPGIYLGQLVCRVGA